MQPKRKARFNPWAWVPTLYFAEGMPNLVVVSMSVLMYKNLGISNSRIAFFTSLIYLAWVVKPLWSPIVDVVGTKRRWIVSMQLAISIAMGLIAGLLMTDVYFVPSLVLLGAVAFLSATHDIAADGFYMLGLSERRQSYFVGVRSVFYKLSTVAVTAGGPFITGRLIAMGMSNRIAWAAVFGIIAAMFLLMGLWHNATLPHPATDHGRPDRTISQIVGEFGDSFSTFFAKPGIVAALLFMVLYRLPEALLVKMITPFLVDPISEGGLGLPNEAVGTVYGLWGVGGLLIGGLLGGWLISRGGLRRWLMPMAVAMSLSCLAFVVLCHVPDPAMELLRISNFRITLIDAMVCLEQLGYGFGFSAYMLYLIYFASGQYSTSHYALATGFMALGLMVPGMFAGMLQEAVGYTIFFWITIACCVTTIGVSLAVVRSIPRTFGCS